MAGRFTLHDVRARTYKERDAWWTVLLVDPVASRLVVPVANRTSVTPNQVTLLGALFGLVAAGLFWMNSPWTLVAGAACFHISFTLDCMDGKIARLKGTGSVLGGWLDHILDRFRAVLCAVGLFGGQYAASDDVRWVWLALAVVFLDMLRYLNGMESTNVYAVMRADLLAASESAGIDPAVYVARLPVPDDTVHTPRSPGADEPAARVLHATVARRYGWFASLRQTLRTRRIRPHLFSGIEFQMSVFIIGPVLAAIAGSKALAVVVLAGIALLVVFELSVMYMTILSAKDLESTISRIRARG